MNKFFNPPHPGETLRDDVLPELGLSVTEAASQLGVTRATLSRVLNARWTLHLSKAVSDTELSKILLSLGWGHLYAPEVIRRSMAALALHRACALRQR